MVIAHETLNELDRATFGSLSRAQPWYAGMRYHVGAFDPAAVGSAIVGVLMLLAIAVWWPARRAAGIDPHEALRHD